MLCLRIVVLVSHDIFSSPSVSCPYGPWANPYISKARDVHFGVLATLAPIFSILSQWTESSHLDWYFLLNAGNKFLRTGPLFWDKFFNSLMDGKTNFLLKSSPWNIWSCMEQGSFDSPILIVVGTAFNNYSVSLQKKKKKRWPEISP